jgi:hypothetical protein
MIFYPKSDPTRKPLTYCLKTRLDMSNTEARANPTTMHGFGVGCVPTTRP